MSEGYNVTPNANILHEIPPLVVADAINRVTAREVRDPNTGLFVKSDFAVSRLLSLEEQDIPVGTITGMVNASEAEYVFEKPIVMLSPVDPEDDEEVQGLVDLHVRLTEVERFGKEGYKELVGAREARQKATTDALRNGAVLAVFTSQDTAAKLNRVADTLVGWGAQRGTPAAVTEQQNVRSGRGTRKLNSAAAQLAQGDWSGTIGFTGFRR
jgi:hypothetical protein